MNINFAIQMLMSVWSTHGFVKAASAGTRRDPSSARARPALDSIRQTTCAKVQVTISWIGMTYPN